LQSVAGQPAAACRRCKFVADGHAVLVALRRLRFEGARPGRGTELRDALTQRGMLPSGWGPNEEDELAPRDGGGFTADAVVGLPQPLTAVPPTDAQYLGEQLFGSSATPKTPRLDRWPFWPFPHCDTCGHGKPKGWQTNVTDLWKWPWWAQVRRSQKTNAQRVSAHVPSFLMPGAHLSYKISAHGKDTSRCAQRSHQRQMSQMSQMSQTVTDVLVKPLFGWQSQRRR
jgi:hypothetical protein